MSRISPARFAILSLAVVVGSAALGGCTTGPSLPRRGQAAVGSRSTTTTTRPINGSTTAPSTTSTTGTTSASGTTSTTTPLPTTTTTGPVTEGPITSPPLPAPGPGFVSDHVTAVGDSVMIDYQAALERDVPGVYVDGAVSRQWSDGEAILGQLKSSGQLGAVVVVGLGTNGPITDADFDTMMSILNGASRVVFVTTHVDQPWQDPVNQVLESGAARYPNVEIADWATLADQNPGWLYSDGTHLPIDGTGAQALAALIASKV